MTTQNIFDMADTWNAGGTTFTAIKMNVTDTASAAGSLLMDLQIGGTSRFSVVKDGGAGAAGAKLVIGTGTPQFALRGRGTDAFSSASPYFQTTTPDKPTAFDIMPNGTIGSGSQAAWMDILLNDISAPGSSDYSALYLGIQSDKCIVGSHISNTGPYTAFLPLLLGGSNITFQAGGYGPVSVAQFAFLNASGLQVGPSGTVFSWLTSSELRTKSSYVLGWTASATDAYGANDTGLARVSAGIVEINNGTVGTLRDLQLRSLGAGGAVSGSTFLNLAAGTTAAAPLRFVEGVAPTSPVDGDMWREDNTNTGLKIRINGVTKTITVL